MKEGLHKGESYDFSPKNLEEIIDEVPTNRIVVSSDEHVPDSVKRKVNNALWDRLQKEDHPDGGRID